MRLSKAEVEAVASIIEKDLYKAQKERIANLFAEYQKTDEYKDLVDKFTVLFRTIDGFNESVPKEHRIDRLHIEGSYDSVSDVKEVQKRIKRLFEGTHTNSVPDRKNIADQIICKSIGCDELSRVIDSIKEAFSKELVK